MAGAGNLGSYLRIQSTTVLAELVHSGKVNSEDFQSYSWPRIIPNSATPIPSESKVACVSSE